MWPGIAARIASAGRIPPNPAGIRPGGGEWAKATVPAPCRPALNRTWLEALMHTANSPGGLHVVHESADVEAELVIAA